MFKKFRKKIATLFSDEKMRLFFGGALIFSICHLYMYIDSGGQIEPLIRLIYCALFFPMAFIFGRKWIKWQYLVIAFSTLYFNKWYNPTSFLLVTAVAFEKPKKQKLIYSFYFFAVVVCLCIGHRNWAHAILHCGYCAGVYIICLDFHKNYQSGHILRLTHDENEILDQLSQGKLKKEITGYSKNTVTKKIQDAMDRNHCSTDGELVCRYKDSGREII